MPTSNKAKPSAAAQLIVHSKDESDTPVVSVNSVRWLCPKCFNANPACPSALGRIFACEKCGSKARVVMFKETSGNVSELGEPDCSTLRIEQPYEIQANDIWFFQTFISHSGAVGGQHIPKAEVERRLAEKAGPGKLVQIEDIWHWQKNSQPMAISIPPQSNK